MLVDIPIDQAGCRELPNEHPRLAMIVRQWMRGKRGSWFKGGRTRGQRSGAKDRAGGTDRERGRRDATKDGRSDHSQQSGRPGSERRGRFGAEFESGWAPADRDG